MCQLLVSGTNTEPPGAWVLLGAGAHVSFLCSLPDIRYVKAAHCSQNPEGATYSPFPHTRFRQVTPTLNAVSGSLPASVLALIVRLK
jgi:hypothetical protein